MATKKAKTGAKRQKQGAAKAAPATRPAAATVPGQAWLAAKYQMTLAEIDKLGIHNAKAESRLCDPDKLIAFFRNQFVNLQKALQRVADAHGLHDEIAKPFDRLIEKFDGADWRQILEGDK